MALTVRKALRLRWFFVVMFMSVLVWGWQARGQNNFIQASTQRTVIPPPPSRSSWECKKFSFGIANQTSSNSVRDLEAFLQTADQAQLVSSGLASFQPDIGHYEVIACKRP